MKSKILFLIGCILLMGCGDMGFRDIRSFNLYKQKYYQQNSMKIRGFYYSLKEYPNYTFLIFYSDGSYLKVKLNFSTDTNRVEQIIEQLKNKNDLKYSDDAWGIYRIHNDSISLQSFEGKEPMGKKELFNEVVVNETGKIINDSTIAFTKWDCKYCQYNFPYTPGLHVFNPIHEFKFCNQLIEKPDSSKVWFKRKSWYRKHAKL